ncbi:MAG: hypothetical protein JSW20_05575 [Nitrospiraceae bacterium]|nr:MAG: hypothetical protein JSW20_05575 [Nitrospiraceae bacterium]
MGFLNKLFSKEKDFPELETSSPIAQRLDNFRDDLEHLARDVSDPIEVVPAEDTAYVFIGKPPKKFGMAWIRDGKIHNFKTMAEEKGIPEMKLQLMSEKLRKAYETNDTANRYSTTIADHKVLVTRSESLEKDLRKIIQ